MNPLNKIVSEIRYRAIRGGIGAVRKLPYSLAINLGRTTGLIAWLAIPLHRKIAIMQMKNTLDDYHWSMSLKAFMYMGEQMVDTMFFSAFDATQAESLIDIEGRQYLDQALKLNRGIMFVTGHIGPWEMIPFITCKTGVDFAVMADSRDDPRLDQLFREIHASGGATILPPKGGMLRTLSERLSSGQHMAIFVDQRGNRSNRILSKFMGLPAPTTPVPAWLALKNDAIVLPVCALKVSGRLRLRFYEPIEARSFGTDAAEIRHLRDAWQSRSVQNLSAWIQNWVAQAVKEYPIQWFWVHSRWTRKKEMRRIINNRQDFKDYINEQARLAEDGFFSAPRAMENDRR